MANDAAEPVRSSAPRILDEAVLEAETQKGSKLHMVLHFCLLVGKSFVKNRCPVRASALAYTTLLALIPLLAVVVSVSTSLLKKEGEKPVEQLIDKLVGSVAPQLNLEVKTDNGDSAIKRQEVVKNITGYIANIQSGTLGATGMIGLVFVAIMLLSTIEATFNDIWGVIHGRSWMKRVVHYWAAITLGPLILIVAIGLTTGPHFSTTKEYLSTLPLGVGEVALFSFRFLPFIILSAAFTLFYQLMPNTPVKFSAALVGGIVGGCLWQLNNIFNVIYVSKVVSYSKIYGSFGMVPIFLVGVYFSWMIMLFGAQVAYAYQNRRTYMQEKQVESINQRGREFVALRIMTFIAERFHHGKTAPTCPELGLALGVPSQLVAQILKVMTGAHLVAESGGTEGTFTPARPLDKISFHDILLAMRASQGQEMATKDEPAREFVLGEFRKIQEAEERTGLQQTLLQVAMNVPQSSENAGKELSELKKIEKKA